jgi:uncharacterized protein YukE
MAGYDLSIDMATLRTLADDLASIKQEFESADENAAAAAEATGHDGLQDRVNEFADKWRIKREDMMADLATLADVIRQVADTFTQVDADLARSLEDRAAQRATR